ncbi:MAG: sigma-54 dependent transcriptional regulator [Desulfuromonadaceae bacterium]|nr:sigma-54 dependent transcriptional regulator [Desulfuromonadaceae bacterium]MDD2848747.1 sigma-54 dependent transcriptional regulator [Desulfuromonadaceae bacterium]MDD4130397.1 sigma-54 dependent transcriptional regulator [Desulfuromonadaceae bacterium]
MKVGRILIVEDDQTFRGLLVAILEDAGYEVAQATDGVAGLVQLQKSSFDLVLSDLKMPKMGGVELFRASRKISVPPLFVLLTAFGTVEEAVAAIKDGVNDFLTKPLKDPAYLRTMVEQLLEERSREQQITALDESGSNGLPPHDILFAGVAMQEVRRLAREVAATEATVLIGGESGTGKELLARYIHLASQRRAGPFVAVNCAAIPDTLLESELFGHERGAFTGASAARQGKFEIASGGTIMLDEIGEMPLSMQVKLLRVLQEKNFQRVGGNKEMRADVRVLAATNRDLAKEVSLGNFREDLYYRLNVFPIKLPPLRDRRDAVDALVSFFIRLHARTMGKKLSGIAASALKALRHYSWPGNVRELQNITERAVILARSEVTMAELPESISSLQDGVLREDGGILKEAERDAIAAALKATAGNRRLAAERLGISRRTLQYRLKGYGMAGEENSE